MILCHVLCRELAWHDLAFYNADLYEGLRRMMLDAEEGKKDQDEFVATYCCYFEVCISHLVTPQNRSFRKETYTDQSRAY